MNKNFYLTAILTATLALSACQDKAASSVDDASINNASPASSEVIAPAAAPQQSLTSSDSRVSLTVNGEFADAMVNSATLLPGIPAEKITLLQQDIGQDVTIFALNDGKVKKDAATYLANLESTLKADSSLSNLAVSPAKDSSISYTFSAGEGEHITNEACIANVVNGDILLMCAMSETDSASELASRIAGVSVK